MYYEQLTAGVIQHDLLVDNLIYKVRSCALSIFTLMRLHKLNIPVNGKTNSDDFGFLVVLSASSLKYLYCMT